jgi:hypothetical protein
MMLCRFWPTASARPVRPMPALCQCACRSWSLRSRPVQWQDRRRLAGGLRVKRWAEEEGGAHRICARQEERRWGSPWHWGVDGVAEPGSGGGVYWRR